MIIPVQCFTCGKQVGHLWETYQQKLQEEYNNYKLIKEDK